MAWQLPNAGPWNQGMAGMPGMTGMAGMPAMTPDMSMGSCTPEQWAMMQQQNWQQWAQWQQQYAQWQNQYGEKYTEQMKAIQAMGGMPPLPPSSAPPPAPPPPDKPPPPPPHENNQPLFSKTPNMPAPVPAPNDNVSANQINKHSGNNTNVNNQQTDTNSWTNKPDVQNSSVNAEALKKLAEEERLFDIQFQKWEDEIEKWKNDNVNHPDKQAYKEYEDKFGACRAQLLERRQQMKQKRARLVGTGLPPTPSTSTTSEKPVQSPAIANQNQQYQNKQQSQNYSGGMKNNSNYGDYYNQYQQHQQYPQKQYQPQQQQQPYQQHTNQQHTNQQHTNQQHQHQNQHYNQSQNRENFTSKDNYDPYQNTNDNYGSNDNHSGAPLNNPSFLPSVGSGKGIPGLDLVPDSEKPSRDNHQVIDITEDKSESVPQVQAPDYTTISKGINNILGDEKIMNILSMVRQTTQDMSKTNVPPPYVDNNQQNVSYGQDNRYQNYNDQQYDNRQNVPFNRQNQDLPMQNNQNQEPNMRYPPPKGMYGNNQDYLPEEEYNYNRNMQHQQDNMRPYDNGPQRSGPPPLMSNMVQPPRFQQRQHMQEIGPNHNNMLNDFRRGPVERKPLHENNLNIAPKEPPKPKWVDEPMFAPSIIVEYEHKPLRLKARCFIEPVHMFDYNHKSKDGEERKDYGRELEEMFPRKPRRQENDYGPERYYRDQSTHYERRVPREHGRDEGRSNRPRDDYEDRKRPERYDDRRKDDRDKYSRRDDVYSRERERDNNRDRDNAGDRGRDIRLDDRDRGRDMRLDDRDRGNYRGDRDYSRHSNESDSRKRGLSKDSDISTTNSKKSKDNSSLDTKVDHNKHVVMIDDLLEEPGRSMRPDKIVIIMRGPPGSGKSYLAKLIRDREAQNGDTVRIMSIDDYFMQEGEIEEKDPTTGKTIKKPTLKYEYDNASEETYLNSLKRAFKRSLTDGYFTFLIFDAVNETLKSYADIWNLGRQNGFQVYVCTMELDAQVCYKRNIHNRTLDDIQSILARFFPTPSHHIQLDATTLLQNAAITEVHMEDADDEVIMEDVQDMEVDSLFTSKWEKMDDAAQLARLDGTSKPLRPSQLSMEDYLQLDDWKPNTAKPGKKSVRWADIEERRQQEKMRAIGFVVGQTDWNRMTDPTMGSSALTQTKYIERVRRH